MKRNLLLYGVSLLVAACGSAQTESSVSLDLSGMDAQDSVLVIYKEHKEKIAAPEGKFTYVFTDSVPGVVKFFNQPHLLKSELGYLPKRVINVMMFPKQSLEIEGSFEDYRISGNDFYDEYNALYDPIHDLNAKRQALNDEYMTLLFNKESKEKVVGKFKEIREVDAEYQEHLKKYIASHPDSELSLYLLYINHPKYGMDYINGFSSRLKSGPMKSMYEVTLAYYDKLKIQEEAEFSIQEGLLAPDFTVKDIHGKDFTLSSLRGKYVVLDFWGSWCGWCIKGFPDMKKVYERYRGKLEIVGVDCRDTEEKWKAAVEKYQLKWLNVSSKIDDKKDLTEIYNVKGYPTKIIISPEGKMVRIFKGESPDFYKALESLIH